MVCSVLFYLYALIVTIAPEVTSKKVYREIVNELIASYQESHLGKRCPAYDGRKSLYTAGPLPFVSQDFVVNLVEKDTTSRRELEFRVAILKKLYKFLCSQSCFNCRREREFMVAIKFAAKADLHPLPHYAVVGRSFFPPKFGDTGDLGDGLEYWKGYYQSLRPTQMGLSLNIDISARAFYEPILVSDFVARYCNVRDLRRPLSDQDRIKVNALLKANCQRPNDRERSIDQIARHNNYNTDKFVNEFGLRVRTELTSVDARVLPAPMLQYQDTQETPRVGAWNMIDKKMVNGGKVKFWTCVSFSRIRRGAHPAYIEKTLLEIHQQSNAQLASAGKLLQLLIIILPDATGTYGRIKRVCETELGIISQCCQPKQASKCQKQYLENVALKINVKAGGRNNVLLNALNRKIPHVTDMPTIIFGADVVHPQPGSNARPSIAAVVASMDWLEVTKYRGLVSAQPHRDEIINDLYKTIQDPQRGMVHSGMIRELLIAFRRSTGHRPHRIIFYRDRVCEGQFNQVLLYEMDAIRKACVSLEENYLPPVTFVVVQKIHHTRLFPAQHNDCNSTDRIGNILPGTVVDTTICLPTEFDFYLCSHAGVQYIILLFHFNKYFCPPSRYARCTRSVSIVPPAYYAHLAAFRARYYIEGETSESKSTSGGRASGERNVEVRPLPLIKDNVKDVMFYC
ncbi:hypothetical protein TEA_019246 [Camellia sinensis var. sinensis]|uniref:Piwi domain-containing protein n=1 Tax=Camellia sinensis var. sinensis TaxID=542762 RepID=A0A4S4DWY2_CAMSN|nr:hypothetical protein TEA_019246 [Camellia sinensis var. sinensis]